MVLKTTTLPVLSFCAWLSAIPLTHAGVVVVSQAPGSTYSTIQDGVNAALDGDIVVIEEGVYAPAHLMNRSLTLVGDGLVRIQTWPAFVGFRVTDLAHSGQSNPPRYVVLKNLEFGGTFQSPVFYDALQILNCSAPVVIESCRINIGTGSFNSGGSGIVVQNSSSVAISNSTVIGGPSYPFSFPLGFSSIARPALDMNASSVQCYGSILRGGAGRDGMAFGPPNLPISPTIGAPAIEMNGGSCLLSACQLIGGDGGDGHVTTNGLYCVSPKAGGSAILLNTSSPTMRVAGSTLVAGATGAPSGSPNCPSPAGAPLTVTNSGSLIFLGAAPGVLVGPDLLREGQASSLSVSANVGDSAILFTATAPAFSFILLPQYAGAFVLGANPLSLPLGTIPAGGSITLPFTVPNLPPSLLSATLFLQAASCSPSGNCALTGPSVLLVLDASL